MAFSWLLTETSVRQAVEVVPGQLVKLAHVRVDFEGFLDWFRTSHVSRHFLRVYWCTSQVQLTRKEGKLSYVWDSHLLSFQPAAAAAAATEPR